MDLTQLKQLLRKVFSSSSLEEMGRYYGCYRGFVHDIQDPKQLGRIVVTVPQIYGEQVYNYWAWPKGMYAGLNEGFFALPSVGSAVWVCFENGDPHYPIWEYGYFGEGDLPKAAETDYPLNQVWQAGPNRVELNQKQGYVRITTKGGTVLEVNADGISLGAVNASKQKAVLGDTLADLIEEVLDALINSKTATALGAMPLTAVPQLVAAKAKVRAILSGKVTLE